MSQTQKLNVYNTIAIPLVHFFGLVIAPIYLYWFNFSWYTVILSLIWFLVCGFSITAGYHRFFTHRSYKCAKIVEWFWALFGAASVQGSAKEWVYTHVLHHASDTSDKIEDPHDIHKGFWWAHWGWMFFTGELPKAGFMSKHSIVQFQSKYYGRLMVFFGFVLPGLIAFIWHDFWGGVLLAGFSRTVLQWHMTWTINSIAHTYGMNLFNRPDNSRNNYVLARLFLALGEMHHSYHHEFPRDYRNGHKIWDIDPSKWLIYGLYKLGLAWDLHITPDSDIEEALKKSSNISINS